MNVVDHEPVAGEDKENYAAQIHRGMAQVLLSFEFFREHPDKRDEYRRDEGSDRVDDLAPDHVAGYTEHHHGGRPGCHHHGEHQEREIYLLSRRVYEHEQSQGYGREY